MPDSTTPMRLLAAAGLWLLATGCGENEAIPAEEFPDRFAAELCAALERCCVASSGTERGGCEADTQAEAERVASDAEADGATWDGAAAARCLDLVSGIDCASFDAPALRELNLACNRAWNGVVPPGGSCRTAASCAPPEVSGDAIGGASCVNEVCVQVVLQPSGAACSSGTTERCDPYVATCDEGTCVALPGPGEPCSGPCRGDARCAEDTCVELLAMGDSCSSDEQCLSGMCGDGRCASGLVGDGDYCALP